MGQFELAVISLGVALCVLFVITPREPTPALARLKISLVLGIVCIVAVILLAAVFVKARSP